MKEIHFSITKSLINFWVVIINKNYLNWKLECHIIWTNVPWLYSISYDFYLCELIKLKRTYFKSKLYLVNCYCKVLYFNRIFRNITFLVITIINSYLNLSILISFKIRENKIEQNITYVFINPVWFGNPCYKYLHFDDFVYISFNFDGIG